MTWPITPSKAWPVPCTRTGTADRHAVDCDGDCFPDAILGVSLQAREGHQDGCAARQAASDPHYRADIMRATAADQNGGGTGRPVEQAHRKHVGDHGSAE